MTPLETYGVKRLYALHCKIVELTAKLSGTTTQEEQVIKEQIDIIEDEIISIHDALIQAISEKQ